MAHPVLSTLGLVSIALIGAGLWVRSAPVADAPPATVSPEPASSAEIRPATDDLAPVAEPPHSGAEMRSVAGMPPGDPVPTAEPSRVEAASPRDDEPAARPSAIAEDASSVPATAGAPVPRDAPPGATAGALLPPPAAPSADEAVADPPDEAAASHAPRTGDDLAQMILRVPPGGGRLLTPQGERLFPGPEETDDAAAETKAPRPETPIEKTAAVSPPAPAAEVGTETGAPMSAGADPGFEPVTYGPDTRLHPAVPDSMTVLEHATFEREFRALSPAPYFGAVAFDGARAVVGAGGYASLEAAEVAVLTRCLQLVANCRIGARYLPADFDGRREGTLSHHQAEVWHAFRTEPLQHSPVIEFHRAFAWSEDGAAVAFDMIGEDATRSMALVRCDAERRWVNRPPVAKAEGCRIGAMRAE